MSRVIGVLVAAMLASALAGCASCSDKNPEITDAWDEGDGGGFNACEQPAWSSSAWTEQVSTARIHVIDGQFGAGEWDGTVRLEGVLTDLYLDYQAPYLYAINDWRINTDGIRPDCYNEFGVKLMEGERITQVNVKVYGDGSITIEGAEIVGEGAYSRSSSAHWGTPHTIYEFRLAVDDFSSVCVRLKDPHNSSHCEELTEEPVEYALSTGTFGTRVARVALPGVAELGLGDACGYGEGICGEGLTCEEEGGSATCGEEYPPVPDDAPDAVSDPLPDVADEVPPDVPEHDVPEHDGPGEDGPWEEDIS